MKDANELRDALRDHSGSEQVYRHAMNAAFNYTEGARAFFQNAGGGAYWLADILATEPAIRAGVKLHGFCLAVLHVGDKGAKLIVARDAQELNDSSGKTTGFEFDQPVYERGIDYTDCPDGFWKFYLTWTEVGARQVVLCLLPSEY